MNILVDKFPTSLQVDGVDYKINTDFRFALSTMLAFEDPDLTDYEKTVVMMYNLYGDDLPENTEEAIKQGQWFLNCGAEEGEGQSGRRLFSWNKDAGFISSAFSATHAVDLQSADMHWWKFYTLFMDLGQSTTFCSLTALRKRYYAGKCTKEERAMIRDMQEVFEVPNNENYSADEQELVDQLMNNYKRAKEQRHAD